MMSFSTKAGEARPVRIDENSAWACSTALSILSPVSKMTVSTNSLSELMWRRASSNQRTDLLFADQDTTEVAAGQHVEHHDGESVVHAEGERGRVHDVQALVERVHVGDLVEACRRRIEAGIGRVDPVDARMRAFQHGLGVELGGAYGGRCVRGEERVTETGGEDDHAALLEVADGAPPDV